MKSKVEQTAYIRYEEGAKRYSMSPHSFMRLAAEAKAVYKINRISLVNVNPIDRLIDYLGSLYKINRISLVNVNPIDRLIDYLGSQDRKEQK